MNIRAFFGYIWIALGAMIMFSSGGCAISMIFDPLVHGRLRGLSDFVVGTAFTLFFSAIPFLIGLGLFRLGIRMAAPSISGLNKLNMQRVAPAALADDANSLWLSLKEGWKAVAGPDSLVLQLLKKFGIPPIMLIAVGNFIGRIGAYALIFIMLFAWADSYEGHKISVSKILSQILTWSVLPFCLGWGIVAWGRQLRSSQPAAEEGAEPISERRAFYSALMMIAGALIIISATLHTLRVFFHGVWAWGWMADTLILPLIVYVLMVVPGALLVWGGWRLAKPKAKKDDVK